MKKTKGLPDAFKEAEREAQQAKAALCRIIRLPPNGKALYVHHQSLCVTVDPSDPAILWFTDYAMCTIERWRLIDTHPDGTLVLESIPNIAWVDKQRRGGRIRMGRGFDKANDAKRLQSVVAVKDSTSIRFGITWNHDTNLVRWNEENELSENGWTHRGEIRLRSSGNAWIESMVLINGILYVLKSRRTALPNVPSLDLQLYEPMSGRPLFRPAGLDPISDTQYLYAGESNGHLVYIPDVRCRIKPGIYQNGAPIPESGKINGNSTVSFADGLIYCRYGVPASLPGAIGYLRTR